jgi:hypothetical protein
MKSMAAFFIATTVCYSSVALAGLFGPSTYDECILANMKGVGSNAAAHAVASACRNQFPPKPVAPKPAEPTATVSPKTQGGWTDPSGRFTDFVPDPVK